MALKRAPVWIWILLFSDYLYLFLFKTIILFLLFYNYNIGDFHEQCNWSLGLNLHWKKCYWIWSTSAISMYIIDLNQNAIELVAYVSFLMEYFFKSIIYMLLTEML